MSGEMIPAGGEFLLYQAEDDRTRVEVRFDAGSVWLTQGQMAELYGTTPQNVTQHLRAIYSDGEQLEETTCKDYLQVREEGTRTVRRKLRYYSLDAILAVGYRVRSPRATQFRRWATAQLGELLTKGFVLDDERLKNPPRTGVPDYFDELLERIRDIRASEARMYLRVRDILALAADYSPSATETQRFFQTIQNKMTFAATGKTAPELIAGRADHTKPNMGLTTWKGGRVLKGDVTVSKNYLTEDEISGLNRIVVMFLDFAEDQVSRRRQILLADWEERLDSFLRFNDRDVLQGLGTVTREDADEHARAEYGLFAQRRRDLAETEGEADTVRALEQAAKELERKKEGAE